MEPICYPHVPYYPQTAYNTCGPACLRMVLARHGMSADEARLTSLCRTGRFGTTPAMIAEAAKQTGLSARTIRRDMALTDLDEALSTGRHVIALVSDMMVLGEPLGDGHFVLVLRSGAETVTFHDPDVGPERRVSRAVFLASWAYHEFGGVVVWKEAMA